MEKQSNVRDSTRYFLDGCSVADIGHIVEISRTGLQLEKNDGLEIEETELTLDIAGKQMNAKVIWQDKKHIGLHFEREFDDLEFIEKNIKRNREMVFQPLISVSEDAIMKHKKDEALLSLVNLLVEVGSPQTDIQKLKMYIDEICRLDEKQARKTGKKVGVDIKEELTSRAARGDIVVKDVDFAIARLGLAYVQDVTRSFVRKRIAQSQTAPSKFQNYELFNALKAVVLKKLTFYFRHTDIETEGNALLAFETAGTEILIDSGKGILSSYYKSPAFLYSEVSRLYEKTLFGMDLLQVNKYYFEKNLKMFGELYDGYVLAHLTLNPHYSPSTDMKLSLTKNGLVFSYMAYLVFLTVNFIMGKDRDSGLALVNRLRGKGITEGRIINFLDECVGEADVVMKDFGLKSVRRAQLPAAVFNIERYLARGSRSDNLVNAVKNLKNSRRLVLRYEDDTYAHFILGKLINANAFGLSSKTYCVIPCENISDSDWYIDDFSYFDLLVFKNIEKLPAFHMKTFIKLWNNYDGEIIATFSNYSFLDFKDKALYALLREHLADFPSYFAHDGTYKKMIDNTLAYMRPYLGGEEMDKDKYLKEVCSMNCVRADLLFNHEIV